MGTLKTMRAFKDMPPANQRRAHTAAAGARGYTLVEFMVAVTLGMMLILVVSSVFISGGKSYREDDRSARMQENGRFAMKVLTEDLGMAGMWGPVKSSSSITSTIGATCPGGVGITFDSTNPVSVIDQATGSGANSSYSCITAANVYDPAAIVAGTSRPDVLVIKRVLGGKSEAVTGSSAAYLKITDGNGELVQTTPESFAGGSEYWQFMPRIYYIRKKSSDSAPTLVMKYLNDVVMATGDDYESPLVDGVENMQVEFGVDTDADGVANKYMTAPTADELANVVNAKIYLLIRSASYEPKDPLNTKTYNLGSTVISAQNDRYQRRVFSTTVSLRNPANLAAAGS